MKLRIGVLFTVAVAFVCVGQSEAAEPSSRPTTIIPSRAEIAAVPAPGRGRLVRYAINIYPSARLARIVLGR